MKKLRGSVLFLLFFLACLILMGSVLSSDLSSDRANQLIYGKVLYLRDINITPLQIAPGSNANISFKIENIGPARLKDIIIEFDLPPEFSPATGEIVKKKIRKMEACTTEEISFSIDVLPNTNAGIYRPAIYLEYLNIIGTVETENQTISIYVGDTPDLIASVSSSEIYDGNEIGEVSIEFINKGLVDVKFLTIKLQETPDFEVISSNIAYIGDVDSDDFETENFKIKILEDKEKINLPLEIEYRDANNKKFSENVEIELKIPSKKEAGKSNGGYIAWLVIVIVLIAGYLFYRFNKKKGIQKILSK